MATVPTPGSQTSGAAILSSLLNGFRDALNFLLGAGSNPRPYCHAYQSATGQTLGAASVTAVVMDAEVKDSDGIHNNVTANSTFTIVTAGLYHVIAQVEFGSTASGHDDILIQHNGTTAGQSTSSPVATTHRLNASCYIQCAAADTIQLEAFSTSGCTLTTGSGNTFMQAFWVSE